MTTRAAISGKLINDTNANGVEDAGDLPLRGWQIYDDADHDATLDSGERVAVTHSNGKWAFPSLPSGQYSLRLASKLGINQAVPARSKAIDVFVGRAGASKGNLFAVQSPAASGIVFNDLNGSKRQDGDEVGLAGWRVFDDVNGNGVFDGGTGAGTSTSADGRWQLPALAPGRHLIRTEGNPRWPGTVGASGYSGPLSAGDSLIADLGFRGILIQGTVFHDQDGDGLRDSAVDSAREGIVVYIDSNRNNRFDAKENCGADQLARPVCFPGPAEWHLLAARAIVRWDAPGRQLDR